MIQYQVNITETQYQKLLSLELPQVTKVLKKAKRHNFRKLTPKPISWTSQYKIGQTVQVKHYHDFVEATLLRQKRQPVGAWYCKKCIKGVWTKESVVNELYFKG